MNQLPVLVRVFAYLSLLTVGGGMAAFPEMKTLTVDVHAWLTRRIDWLRSQGYAK